MWEQGPWHLLPQYLEEYLVLDNDDDDDDDGDEDDGDGDDDDIEHL